MKITIVLNKSDLPENIINELKVLGEVDIIDAKNLSENDAIEKIPETEILICGSSGFRKIGKTMINGLKKLRFISVFGVGVDWIDISETTKRNIVVSIAKGCNSEAVAEHTWGMILNLSKRISESERDTRNKGQVNVFNYQGLEVYKKTIGIIGLGDIGQSIARIANGFEMKILGTSKSMKSVSGIETVSLDVLLKSSDIVTLCLPLNKETENIIDIEEVQKMKKHVIVINCSREKLVNKKAILKGIADGKVFGYGVETDIFEKISADDGYFKYPQVLLTPHNAWNTKESRLKTLEVILENVKAYLKGCPINTVK